MKYLIAVVFSAFLAACANTNRSDVRISDAIPPNSSLAFILFKDPHVDGRTSSAALRERITGRPVPAQGGAMLESIGTNEFRVTLPGIEDHYTPQDRLDTCWAAAAQTIHSYEGRPFTQEVLAKRFTLKSEKHGHAARPTQILLALAPEKGEDYLKSRSILALETSLRAAVRTEDLIAWLSAGHPVLVGLDQKDSQGREYHHVYTLIGAMYHEVNGHGPFYPLGSRHPEDPWVERTSNDHLYAISEVVLLDPWKGRGRMTMSGPDFADTLSFASSSTEAEWMFKYLAENARKDNEGIKLPIPAPDIRLPGLPIIGGQ